MKTLLKNWLGITEPQKIEPVDYVKIQAYVDDVMSQYSPAECAHCKKKLIAHRGGFYRSAEGVIHCSHECIYESGSAVKR